MSQVLYGTPLSFTVKPQVVIGVPTIVSPLNGDSVGLRPHFVIKNATTSNAVGAIVYNYQISRNSSFTDKVESGHRSADGDADRVGRQVGPVERHDLLLAGVGD